MKSPGTIIATAALLVALVGNTIVYRINNDQQITAINAKTALCALRTNIEQDIEASERSVANTKEIIADHPEGFLGYSPAQLQDALNDQVERLGNQRDNYAALSVAQCKEG